MQCRPEHRRACGPHKDLSALHLIFFLCPVEASEPPSGACGSSTMGGVTKFWGPWLTVRAEQGGRESPASGRDGAGSFFSGWLCIPTRPPQGGRTAAARRPETSRQEAGAQPGLQRPRILPAFRGALLRYPTPPAVPAAAPLPPPGQAPLAREGVREGRSLEYLRLRGHCNGMGARP